jgi:WD40 repeat protein
MSTAPQISRIATPKWIPTVLPLPYMVNSVAISDDAKRVIACYYYYPYPGTTIKETHGLFCAYCSDPEGNLLWSDAYFGCQGVFAVAISGNGKIAAAGGLLTDTPAFKGLLRAYDADTGHVLLDYADIRADVPAPGAPPPAFPDTGRRQRVSCVALSDDGGVLAAVADKVYVFVRNGAATFPAQPTEIIAFADAFNKDHLAQAVAVDPAGKWLAACDKSGNVCMAEIAKGKVQAIYKWSAPQVPIDRNNPASGTGSVVFLSVASSKDDSFVVGGGDFVYLFTLKGMRAGADPIKYDTYDPVKSVGAPPVPGAPPVFTPPQNVRWVAISDDGDCVTTVVNRSEHGARTGSLLRLDGDLKLIWEQPLARNPNATSVDGKANYVAASDGYPVGKPGAFYLFEASTGKRIWDYSTINMNWPIVISNNGKGIAAGSDDGMLYYFDI